MEHIKLLIVDDVEDNRLVLRAICRKIEGLDIHEAVDGEEAVELCDTLRPHIVLMDVMMPRMNGFQASKLIKERYPETIVMAVTAVIDPKMEENMASIGVSAYIRKPIDKELIRLKIQSYAASLSIGGREKKFVVKKRALNPFSDEVRNFKILFEINTPDAIMDFGIWLMGRFECAKAAVCTKIDTILELFYELIHQEIKNGQSVTLTIEESFDEMFLHIPLFKPATPDSKTGHLIGELGSSCLIRGDMAAFRLPFHGKRPDTERISGYRDESVPGHTRIEPVTTAESMPVSEAAKENNIEKRQIGVMERQVLRESFVHKITAKEYVSTIDNDAFGEVRDLREAEVEWEGWIAELSYNPTADNLRKFADEVLDTYSNAISALYEFSGLSYAIVSLKTLIKSQADVIMADETKRKSMLEFLGYFKNDLSSWLEHVFEVQDAQDIHYLDGSFFSSCMQIEGIIDGTEFDSGEEGDIEFF